jgi:hypothetical protein
MEMGSDLDGGTGEDHHDLWGYLASLRLLTGGDIEMDSGDGESVRRVGNGDDSDGQVLSWSWL